MEMIDGGFPRIDEWCLAIQTLRHLARSRRAIVITSPRIPRHRSLAAGHKGEALSEQQRDCSAPGRDFSAVVQSADQLRRKTTDSLVVNRNINYTNICWLIPVLHFFKGKCQKICVADLTY